MRVTTMTVGILALLWTGAVPAGAGTYTQDQMRAAAAKCKSVNGVCPVMGRLVTPQGGSATYEGETIAFCCPGCKGKFEADPVRYMDLLRMNPPTYWYASRKPGVVAMRKAKAAAASANGLCPVLGQLVTAKGGSATYKGQKIAFCCPGCEKKFAKDPESFMRKMRADPLAYAYDRPGPTNAQLRTAREAVKACNGLCPVMHRLVTAKGGFTRVGEQKVAFCCPGCKGKFEADPQGFLARMRAEPAVYGYVAPASAGTR
jgi:YHS domain-containing protein